MSKPDSSDALARVTVLAPAPDSPELGTLISTYRRNLMPPFAERRVRLVDRFSQAILRHPQLKRDAGAVALAFWLRRSNLHNLEIDFASAKTSDGLRVAAGLVFHIAPANVDTMFVFSWALSFLAGNANIVRLTSRMNSTANDLIACLNEVLAAEPDDASMNVFVSYEHDKKTTGTFSQACDFRVIWGGDETVRRIREVALSPHAGERAFPSKRSLAVVGAGRYLELTEAGRDEAARRMTADLAPFGQMACSSPHVVYWIGGADIARQAAADFSQRLEAAMAQRASAPELADATRRINHAFATAAAARADAVVHRRFTTAIRAVSVATAEGEDVCGSGMLAHVEGTTIPELAATLRVDHQTISYCALSDSERDELAKLAGRAGVDRIVPFGQALNFGPKWDGFDLWTDFTRWVVVQ